MLPWSFIQFVIWVSSVTISGTIAAANNDTCPSSPVSHAEHRFFDIEHESCETVWVANRPAGHWTVFSTSCLANRHSRKSDSKLKITSMGNFKPKFPVWSFHFALFYLLETGRLSCTKHELRRLVTLMGVAPSPPLPKVYTWGFLVRLKI